MNLATLGDYPAAYTSWVAAMKMLGAEISFLPNDPKPVWIGGTLNARVAAVFRDPAKWVPLVNARKLPTPATAYSKDGKTAYYVAPDDVQRAHAYGSDAESQKSADAATPDLLDRWGFPKDLGKYVRYAAIGGGVILGISLLNALRGR